MTKYLLPLAMLIAAMPAVAQERLPVGFDPSINGETILAEGEILASQWLNDSYQNWHFVVLYAQRIWKCEERIGFISCNQMGRR